MKKLWDSAQKRLYNPILSKTYNKTAFLFKMKIISLSLTVKLGFFITNFAQKEILK